MRNTKIEDKYLKAKTQVDRLRGFYIHVIIYVVVNIVITSLKINRNLNNGESFEQALFDAGTFIVWGLWGIGLGLHAFSVFGLPLILGKNWEEEKIKEFMNEEQSQDWK
ncbi:MAG: 2TM domain-containing protein [Bacteroidia bacterium]|nr:2TM domain-containing protein [Bacteroidia bacterium]NND24690.1 2TM domain-containing protein [Flavobacteriaceae bacterium]MBT8278236.1 2TM domain-containing protein [Bacteroidia bacterium]NNK59032.1 2TM domain-containing protein [Flavobacteriaceae bacterium]NNL33826.1 2TM domain-containing protein [Flavobacteriaceae bacterium]